MKKINVLCVLVLALMLIDLVVGLFLDTSDARRRTGHLGEGL